QRRVEGEPWDAQMVGPKAPMSRLIDQCLANVKEYCSNGHAAAPKANSYLNGLDRQWQRPATTRRSVSNVIYGRN
ncbi:MAG: hypothetical protein ABL889_15695, partial [Terricaulis sp.]